MDIAYPHVAERLFGRPLAIDPLALRSIMDGPLVKRVLSGDKIGGKQAKKGRDIRRDRLALIAQAEQVKSADGLIEYGLTAEGIAIVPIAGVLSRRFDWMSATCGWTTYDGLGATLDTINDDSRVKAVLLDVDSPGGEADGMLDIADALLAARSQKPLWAVANTLAASAAYALGGSAETLYLPRLAQIGSIGCVTIHVDQSAADQAQGLNYTAIYSGARKVDGWGHAPLSEPALKSAQAGVDHVRDQFAALVGRQGRLSQKAAMATEAAIYADQSAVDAKLADRVGTFADALSALTEQVSQTRFMKGNAMTKLTFIEPAAGADPAKAASVEPGTTAAAAPAKVAITEHHAEMDKPKPGENCKLCGKMYDDGDDNGCKTAAAIADVPAVAASAAASAASYGEAEINETLEVCTLAKLPLGDAQAFIKAKIPVAKVRDTVIAKLAQSSDSQQIHRATVTGDAGDAKSEHMATRQKVQAKIKAELGIK